MMKMNRRCAWCLLALGVILALLVTPGLSFVQAQDKTTITMWHWGGVEDKAQQDAKLAELFPELFENITVDHLSIGGQDIDVYQQLRLALAAGQDLPDIVTMNYTALPEFATADVLMDLSDCLEPYRDDLTQAAVALSDYDGKVVAIPKQAKTKLWFYRKDMFAEAGIDPNAIVTFDDFVAAGVKFHEAFPDSYIINLGPQPIHYWYFMILSNWDTVRVADKDGNYQLTSDEHFATLLDWMKAMQGIAFPTDDFSADWAQAFIDGKIGSWLGASWGWIYPIERWSLSPNPEQWGVALWPEFSRMGAELGGDVLIIPKGAEHPDLACEYLASQFLTTEGSMSYFYSAGVVPITKSGIAELTALAQNPTKPAGMSDEAWALDPINFWGTTLPEYMEKSYQGFQIFPYDPAASAELDILRQHTEAYLAGDVSLEDALQGAQSDMESQIGNPYEF